PDGWVDTAGPVRVHGAEPGFRPPSNGSGRYEVITTEPVHVSITRDKAGEGVLTFPPTPGITRPTDGEAARALLTAAAKHADGQGRDDLRLAHQAKTLDPVADGLFVTFRADNKWNLMPAGGALTPLPPVLRRFISKTDAIEFAGRAAILLHTPPLAGATPPLDFADPHFEDALARHLAGTGAHPSTLQLLLLATRAGLDRDHGRPSSRFVRDWATYEHNPDRAAPQGGHTWADELKDGDWIALTVPGHPIRQVAQVTTATTDTLGAVRLDITIDGIPASHTVARNTSVARATTARPVEDTGRPAPAIPQAPERVPAAAAAEEPAADASEVATSPSAAEPSPSGEDLASTVRAHLLARLEEYQEILELDPGMARLARDPAPGPVVDEQVLHIAVVVTSEGAKATASLGHEPDTSALAWTATELRTADPNDLLETLRTPPGVPSRPRTGMPAAPSTPPEPSEATVDGRLHQLLATAQALLVSSLNTGDRSEPARRYLAGRGVPAGSPVAAHWGIGFAPSNTGTYLTDSLRAQGYSDAELAAAGVSAEGARGLYDALRNRVTFPILDLDGRVIAFTGRALRESDRAPKWLNTRNTGLYTKSEALLGPGHHRQALAAPQRGPFVIAEGAFDLVAVGEALNRDDRPAPIPVAPCGTALTPQHVAMLANIDARRDIVVVFDPDRAGDIALRAAWELLLGWQGRTFAIRLPAGTDPDAKRDPGRIFETEGADQLRTLMLTHVQPLLDAVVDAELAPLIGDPTREWKAPETAAELILHSGDPQQVSRQVPRLGAMGLDPAAVAQEIERQLSHLADSTMIESCLRELRAAMLSTEPTPHTNRNPSANTVHPPQEADRAEQLAAQADARAHDGPVAVPELPPAVPTDPANAATTAEPQPASARTTDPADDPADPAVANPDGHDGQDAESTLPTQPGDTTPTVGPADPDPIVGDQGGTTDGSTHSRLPQPRDDEQRRLQEEPAMATPTGQSMRPDSAPPGPAQRREPSGPSPELTYSTALADVTQALSRPDLSPALKRDLQERWVINAYGEDHVSRSLYGAPVGGIYPGTAGRRPNIDVDFDAPEPGPRVAGFPAQANPLIERIELVGHLETRAAEESLDPRIATAFRAAARQLRLEVNGRPADRPGAPPVPDPPQQVVERATQVLRSGSVPASPQPLAAALEVPYSHAEKVLDLLEKTGVVTPLDSAGRGRDVIPAQARAGAAGPAPTPSAANDPSPANAARTTSPPPAAPSSSHTQSQDPGPDARDDRPNPRAATPTPPLPSGADRHTSNQAETNAAEFPSGAAPRTVTRRPTPDSGTAGAAPQPQPQVQATAPAPANPTPSTTAGQGSPDSQATPTTPMDHLTDAAATAITEAAGGTQSAAKQVENLRREVAALRTYVEQMFSPEDALATQTTATLESPAALAEAIGVVERDAAWYLNMPQWRQIQSVQAAALDAWSTISEHLQRVPGDTRLERLARAVTALGAQGVSVAAFSLAHDLTARGHSGSAAWTALRNLYRAADGLRARVLGRGPSPHDAQLQIALEGALQAFAQEMHASRSQQASDTPPRAQAMPTQPPAETAAKATDDHGLTRLRSA
ncbi:toprim domain-containing protein, partial [Kitasatospora purpeofusca]|uniref:toprim domain-containing protein n=1 Tax=Kitasatospora purpeofusca TaxID=67352 RepID=UPI0035E2F60E